MSRLFAAFGLIWTDAPVLRRTPPSLTLPRKGGGNANACAALPVPIATLKVCHRQTIICSVRSPSRCMKATAVRWEDPLETLLQPRSLHRAVFHVRIAIVREHLLHD